MSQAADRIDWLEDTTNVLALLIEAQNGRIERLKAEVWRSPSDVAAEDPFLSKQTTALRRHKANGNHD